MEDPRSSQPERMKPCVDNFSDSPESDAAVSGAWVSGKIKPTARKSPGACEAILSNIQRLISLVGQNVPGCETADSQVSKTPRVNTRELDVKPWFRIAARIASRWAMIGG